MSNNWYTKYKIKKKKTLTQFKLKYHTCVSVESYIQY